MCSTTEPKIAGDTHPSALGLIKLDRLLGFNPTFLKECLRRALGARKKYYENQRLYGKPMPEGEEHAELLTQLVNDPDTQVYGLGTVLPFVSVYCKYDTSTNDHSIAAGTRGGCNFASLKIVKMISEAADMTAVEEYTIPIDKYLIAIPHWNGDVHANINIISSHTERIGALVSVSIDGGRVWSDGFAASVEAWWRRAMLAYAVDSAVLTINDGQYSKVLTENDTDTTFVKKN